MTIAERINLHRCGYSKSEIAELAAAEKAELEAAKNAPQDPPTADPAPAQDPPAPDPAPDPILSAINNLTAAIQANNIIRTPAPAPQPAQTVDDLIKTI